MAIYFLDSSALAKHYISEAGSRWVSEILEPSAENRIYAARIGAVEVMAAIMRRIRSGSILPKEGGNTISRFRADFARAEDVVEISPDLVARALDIVEKHALRGYDAVQLAAAITVHQSTSLIGIPTIFVSADLELNAAAEAEGLRVENPELHR